MRVVIKCLVFVLVLMARGGTAKATPQFPPTQICRGDDGTWRVINDYLGGWYFQVFYEDDDRARFVLDLEEAIPKEEWNSYVGMTSAGPEWSDDSLHYFIDLHGKPHFCVRTWWDRRILTTVAAMVLGNLVIYTCGVLWLSVPLGLGKALAVGLYPFVLGDLIKVVLAALLLPTGWALLGRSSQ